MPIRNALGKFRNAGLIHSGKPGNFRFLILLASSWGSGRNGRIESSPLRLLQAFKESTDTSRKLLSRTLAQSPGHPWKTFLSPQSKKWLIQYHLPGSSFHQTWQFLSLIHISEPTRRTPISYAV